jgi:hypothetical protein
MLFNRRGLETMKSDFINKISKETCLSMSIFLNLSHSPILVMQNGDSGTSSPVQKSPASVPNVIS